MSDRIDEHLGRRLYKRRKALGLTQHELARRIGVRFQQIQKYECAENCMSARRVWQLAAALEVPVSYFYDGLSEAPAPSVVRTPFYGEFQKAFAD